MGEPSSSAVPSPPKKKGKRSSSLDVLGEKADDLSSPRNKKKKKIKENLEDEDLMNGIMESALNLKALMKDLLTKEDLYDYASKLSTEPEVAYPPHFPESHTDKYQSDTDSFDEICLPNVLITSKLDLHIEEEHIIKFFKNKKMKVEVVMQPCFDKKHKDQQVTVDKKDKGKQATVDKKAIITFRSDKDFKKARKYNGDKICDTRVFYRRIPDSSNKRIANDDDPPSPTPPKKKGKRSSSLDVLGEKADDPPSPRNKKKVKGSVFLLGKRFLQPSSKQKILKKKSEGIKEMNKSIKELSEAVKKLQEILLTKAFLPEEKETPKEMEKPIYECCFACEEASGDSNLTLFVKGFENLRPRQEIKKALTNIFSSFGEVTRVFVPIECKTRLPLGFAFIDLRGGGGNEKALELNGKCVEGRELEVTMAIHRSEYYGFTDFYGCDRCIDYLDKSGIFSGSDMDYSYVF